MYREIDRKTFGQKWRAIHDSVFSGCPADEQPFRNPAWDTFLFPYRLEMEEDVFNAIAQAARQLGDHELIIMNAEVLVPEPAAAISWSYSELDEVRCTTLGHFESHLYGHSASWGMVCAVDDFSRLGGRAPFMNVVAKALGGRVAIRERFLRFAAQEWQVTQEFRRKVLRSAGWEEN